MKPSERISEIENQDDNTNRTDAIIQYLDEEWETRLHFHDGEPCYVSPCVKFEE